MVCDVSFPELFLLLLLQQDLHKELKIKIKNMHTTSASILQARLVSFLCGKKAGLISKRFRS